MFISSDHEADLIGHLKFVFLSKGKSFNISDLLFDARVTSDPVLVQQFSWCDEKKGKWQTESPVSNFLLFLAREQIDSEMNVHSDNIYVHNIPNSPGVQPFCMKGI